jgi:4-carboxymuconolactone decarboxylase
LFSNKVNLIRVYIQPFKGLMKGYYTMNEQKANARESLLGLSQGDASRLGFLQNLIADSYTESGLDPQTFMLVRMAALATLDAAPASWLMNIAVSGEAGLEPEMILGTLTAIAPVIGTARVVSAAGHILQALELGQALAESEE